MPKYILTISFFNLVLILANPLQGGDRAAQGLNQIGTSIEGGIDTVANAVGSNDTVLGGVLSGIGSIIGGVGETPSCVVNNTAYVSKSQKNIFCCLQIP